MFWENIWIVLIEFSFFYLFLFCFFFFPFAPFYFDFLCSLAIAFVWFVSAFIASFNQWTSSLSLSSSAVSSVLCLRLFVLFSVAFCYCVILYVTVLFLGVPLLHLSCPSSVLIYFYNCRFCLLFISIMYHNLVYTATVSVFPALYAFHSPIFFRYFFHFSFTVFVFPFLILD